MKHESITEAAKALPPVGVGGLTLAGLPLNEWVLILTIIYTLFLIVEKAPAVWARLVELFKKLRGTNE